MIDTRLIQRLGYSFLDEKLLELALTHRSVSQVHNYERLEFLGDAILSAIIAAMLLRHYPSEKEGRLTRIRATLVRQETLSLLAQNMELGPHLQLSQSEKKSGGHGRESILADVVEAIIGAIFLDSHDFAIVAKLVEGWYAPFIANIQTDTILKDAKTQLQEWLQAQHLPLPKYELLSVAGDAPKQIFTTLCSVVLVNKTQHQMQGVGASRRLAEQMAAQSILHELLEHSHGQAKE